MNLLTNTTSNPTSSVAGKLRDRTGSFELCDKFKHSTNVNSLTARGTFIRDSSGLMPTNSEHNKNELKHSATLDINAHGKSFTDSSFTTEEKRPLLNQTMISTNSQSHKLVPTKYVNGLIQYWNSRALKFKEEKQALEEKIKEKIAIRNQSVPSYKDNTPIENKNKPKDKIYKPKDTIKADITKEKEVISKRSLTPEVKKNNKPKRRVIKTFEYKKREYSYRFTPGKGCALILVLFSFISNRLHSLCIWPSPYYSSNINFITTSL